MNRARKYRDATLGYVLTAPLVLWILLLKLYPLTHTFLLSFRDQRLIGGEAPFVGMKLYHKLIFRDPEIWIALRNSVTWVLGNVLIQLVVGILLAILLQQKFAFRSGVRTWLMIPWFTPAVVLSIMWKWILSPTTGVINDILLSLNVIKEPIVFFSGANAMKTLIGIHSWRYIPFVAVVVLARLITIPRELYEAAMVDGASSTQQLRFITIPHIKGVVTSLGLLATIWTLNTFDIIWITTSGGPGTATLTLPVVVFLRGFKAFRLSEAAVLSVLMFFMALVIMILFFRFQKHEAEE